MRSLLGVALLALTFASVPAAADEAECTVVTTEAWPDVNFVTLCIDGSHTYGDGTQEFHNDHLVHLSHAFEADPAFDYAYARADQGTWVYDDGEVRQEREYTHVGAGAFEGVRGLSGGGAHANLRQRDQSAVEDEGDACASHIGRSTCFGAGGWWTVQDVASAGVGVYYDQREADGQCSERAEVDVDAVVVFVPIVTEPGPCSVTLPWLYDEVPFRDVDLLP